MRERPPATKSASSRSKGNAPTSSRPATARSTPRCRSSRPKSSSLQGSSSRTASRPRRSTRSPRPAARRSSPRCSRSSARTSSAASSCFCALCVRAAGLAGRAAAARASRDDRRRRSPRSTSSRRNTPIRQTHGSSTTARTCLAIARDYIRHPHARTDRSGAARYGRRRRGGIGALPDAFSFLLRPRLDHRPRAAARGSRPARWLFPATVRATARCPSSRPSTARTAVR